MQVETVRIPYKTYSDVFTLMPIADIHLGNKTCDKAKLKRDLKEVDKKTLILGIGDWLDSIIIKDIRYRKGLDDSETEEVIDDQIKELYDIMNPYAKNIIGVGDGNHEQTIIEKCSTNPIKRLCEKLSTPEHPVLYLGYSWLLRLIFHINNGAAKSLIIRAHHGWGGSSRTEGADITKYSHDVKFWQADLFLYGHTHRLKTNDVEEGRMVGDRGWMTFTKKMCVCGTYQRTYSTGTTATWAETRGFPPTTTRHPKIFLRPTDKCVEVKVQT